MESRPRAPIQHARFVFLPAGALTVGLILSTGCSTKTQDVFGRQVECANQARQFAADWQHEFASFPRTKVSFRNHYNRTDGHCYIVVHSFFDSGVQVESIKDALEGIGGPEIAFYIPSNERSTASDKGLAKIRLLMEDGNIEGK